MCLLTCHENDIFKDVLFSFHGHTCFQKCVFTFHLSLFVHSHWKNVSLKVLLISHSNTLLLFEAFYLAHMNNLTSNSFCALFREA